MEKVKEKRQNVLDFLQVDEYPDGSGYGSGYGDGDGYGYGYGSGSGSGSGYGSGSGSGYGDGDGYGSGYGDGYGDGDGDGYGSGYGSGDGSGDGLRPLLSISGKVIHVIDGVHTIIESTHTNYACGYILSSDLTQKPCFIAKCGNYFAHGETLKQAFDDAREKYERNAPVEERITSFNEKYPDNGVKIPAKELFSWHHILTGSCLAGRKLFCNEHGIDVDNDSFTVMEFITLTENDYGKDIIRQLKSSRT